MGPGFLAAAGRINWVDREGWFDASIFKGDTLVGNFDLMGGAAHLSAWRCLECRLLLIDYGNGVVQAGSGTNMSACDQAHRLFDPVANGSLQVGTLPPWLRVQGKVAWTAWRGPVEMLGEAWVFFHRKVRATEPGRPNGPPGEVFLCRAEDHRADRQTRRLTLLYQPLE